MPLDTCICGSCQQTFTDLNEFIAHKHEGCAGPNISVPQEQMNQAVPAVAQGETTKVIQVHMNEVGEITRLDAEPGQDGEENNNGNGTLTFLSDVNLDAELDSPNCLDGHGGQGPTADTANSQTLIILKNEAMEERTDMNDVRTMAATTLSGLEGAIEGLSGSQLVNQVQDSQSRTTTYVLSPEQFAEILRKQQQPEEGEQDGDGTSEPPPKKRRVARAKKGEGKNKVMEAVPPSTPRPAAPEANSDGTLSCPQCKRTFTKERHFNTHKCLASSSYVDITKKEIMKLDSDEEEGEKNLYLQLDDGAHDDDGEEYSAPVDENLRVEKEDEEEDEEMSKDDGDDFDASSKKRTKKKGRRSRSKAHLQGMTTVRANALHMKNAVEAMENLPIFKNEEEKVAFEACVDVDLSQTDDMFRVHVIEQELNEMSGMVYNTPTVSSLSVYSCTVCEKVFKSLSHIRLHCVTHTQMKPFKCNKCDYSTNSKGNLYTHMRKHTGQFYRCDMCDFKSVNKSHLIEHQMTHDSRRPQCMLCQKDYSTIKSLINHIRKYHTNKAGKEYLATFLSGRGMKGNTIIHQCHVCNRKFKKRIDRDRHLFIHDIKDIPNVQQCDLCEYWASRRVYLDKHYLKHRVIYCCTMCDLKFLSITRLSEHLNSEHSVSGENGNLMSETLLEDCINRSYYLPEPVATSVEGSKYINLPEVLTDLNPDSSQAAVENLQFINDSTGSAGNDAQRLENAAFHENKKSEQSESDVVGTENSNVLAVGCAASEVNIGQLEGTANPDYCFPSEYRDFMNDSSRDAFPLDDASKTDADSNEGMGTQGGYNGMMKDSEEIAGQLLESEKDNLMDSSGNFDDANKSDKEHPPVGDVLMESVEQSQSDIVKEEAGGSTDLNSSQNADGQFQDLASGNDLISSEKCTSEMPSMVLMLQNPGSDSDKEEDHGKSEPCSDEEKGEEEDGKEEEEGGKEEEEDGKEDSVNEKTGMDDMAHKTNVDDSRLEGLDEASDENDLSKDDVPVSSGDVKGETNEGSNGDDKEGDEGGAKVQVTEGKEKGTKEDRINGLIKRLGYRRMSFEIFNKMRETFGTEECEYCGRLFYNKVDHENHVRTHTGDKPFACTHCSFRSSTRDGLRRHSEKEHEKVAYQCKECDFLAPTRTRLWNHQLKHLGITGLSCPQCPNKFDSMKHLRAHLVNSHKDMDKDTMEKLTGYMRKPQGKMGRRSFKCPHCPRVFIRANSELQKHIWIHEGIKPFACPICTYACRSKNNLQAHMLRHSSEKPFSCTECGKEYKSKTALRWHVRSHKAGKLFKCDKCPYEATQASHLKRHMETHDIVKRFICKHCNFSANTLGYMKIHYAKHHKGLPFVQEESVQSKANATNKGVFKCLSCGYLFGNLSDLKRHLKIRHLVHMQAIAGMDQMQISQVEVVQYDDTNPHPATSSQRIPETTVAPPPLLQPAQSSGELQQIRPNNEDGTMSLSAVNLIQQIFGMSHGDNQVRVVSEDGEPLDISSDTIILQQDGQLLMTAGDNSNIVSGNQYVIQYFNPGELSTQETPSTMEDTSHAIQQIASDAPDQIHLMNAPSADQEQATQFIITANGQTQLVTSSGPPQILSQADSTATGQLVFTPDGQTQLVSAGGQPQILTTGNSGSHLISIDGQNQQLLTTDGSQFVTPEFDESYNDQLIISETNIVEEGLSVTGVDKNGQEQAASHIAQPELTE